VLEISAGPNRFGWKLALRIEMSNLMHIEQLRAEYADAFRCIGPDCEDDCCHGWGISLDRSTFEKYQRLPGLQQQVSELIQLNEHATEIDHARVKLKPSGNCPFLGEDRLCNIQKAHGEEYLSTVCATYPRVDRIHGGMRERALSLSCPEAARLVLLNPRLLPGYEPASTHARYRDFLMKKPAPVNYAASEAMHFFWPLRGFMVAVLTDRRYALWERMFVLGMFCGRLQAVISAKEWDKIPKLLNDYADMMVDKKPQPALAAIPTSPGPQLEVAVKLLQRSKWGVESTAFGKCMEGFAEGLAYSPEKPLAHCLPVFEEAYRHYYSPLMEAHPHILENFLLNYVIKNRLPLEIGETANCQTSFFVLCILFAGIKGALIGIAALRREAFEVNDVLKLIYSFSRRIDHDRDLLKDVHKYLQDANLLNTGGMALLLKN